VAYRGLNVGNLTARLGEGVLESLKFGHLILRLHASARRAFAVIGIQNNDAASDYAWGNPNAAKNPFPCISANGHGFMMIVQWQGKQANSSLDPEWPRGNQACDHAFFLS